MVVWLWSYFCWTNLSSPPWYLVVSYVTCKLGLYTQTSTTQPLNLAIFTDTLLELLCSPLASQDLISWYLYQDPGKSLFNCNTKTLPFRILPIHTPALIHWGLYKIKVITGTGSFHNEKVKSEIFHLLSNFISTSKWQSCEVCSSAASVLSSFSWHFFYYGK